MAEFKKLSEVEQIETASDNATVLIEEDGDIKRVPKKEVGGAGSGSVIFYIERSAATPMATDASSTGYKCNKTYAELMEIYNEKPYELGDAIYVEIQGGNNFNIAHCDYIEYYDASFYFNFSRRSNSHYIELTIYDDNYIEAGGGVS